MERSVLCLQVCDILRQCADMFDSAVEYFAFTRLDTLASLTFEAIRASARECWNVLPKLVEMRVQVLAIATLDCRVWDALTFATTVARFARYVIVVILGAGL